MERKLLAKKRDKRLMLSCRRLLLLFCCFNLLNANVLLAKDKTGQDRTIGGVVVAASGETLPGVTITVKGTRVSTTTDTEGKFSIKVPTGAAELVVSFIGMKTQTVVIGTSTELRITLAEESVMLQEVVAIGYGTIQKKDLSGSVTNVSEKDFNKGVVTSPEQLMQGKVSGLVVTRPGGDPTQEVTMRLRGSTSLMGGNGPLVVIDGVPGASINSVAPQDIASISVLKDASAAAIYGARSANGVILITTKKGKAGKTAISYDGYFATENLANNLDMLTAEDWRNYVQSHNITNAMDYGADTKWQQEVYRRGHSQNHNISLTGGTESSTYRASVNYLDQKGIVLSNDLQRVNANIAFDQTGLDGKLKLLINANTTIEDWGSVPTANVFAYALNLNPTIPVYDENGKFKEVSGYEYYNPVAMLNQMTSDSKRNQFLGRMQLEYTFFKGFSAAINGSISRRNLMTGYYESRVSRAAEQTNGFARRTTSEDNSKLIESTLTYDRTFNEKHKINAILGYSYQEFTPENFAAQNRDFITDLFLYNNLGAGNNLTPTDISSFKEKNKLISFYARANYSFDGRYIFTGTIRRDGSTRFGKDNKWGIFPSGSVAWAINKEPFLRDVRFIDELKLRTSYGITGNQEIPNYTALALYGAAGYYYQGGEFFTQYAPNQNPNPNLKWEETAQFDAGIDYSFLGGRFRGSIDYYNKQTSNLLYNYPVPTPPYQYNTMMANVGEVENKGIELSLESTVINSSEFKWNLGLNFARNKNKLKSLSNDEFKLDVVYTGEWALGGLQETPQILKPGYAIGTFYGAKYIGRDANGIFQYEDVSGDGKFVYADDRTVIGNAQPDFTLNMSNSLKYKNFSLDLLLRGVFGNDIANSTALYLNDINRMPGNNVLKTALDIAAQPLVYSSYYIEDGSFVRLEYLTLGYDVKLPPSSKIKNLRLSATANNLFIITNYTGIDPEVNVNGLVFGIDARNYYPKTRSFSLGVNFSF
ncbi:iron complex outermembrane receptor protein [Arcticibacter tournemirensis]|uniref:TonB-dependent receptor n=1 Tax=Arcticibacter tournemirensis TaxID=699437 RepID=A0A5M9H872_9SPHI|nr:TonB-dependent receptor [Arcticibacter tournemirensis]KAA8483143.1 TonB-dependent receptor [Arcticibacter tournemirensis]TQM51941.1 iron complex outermembrane receptor protein [Arcticibacter tournemirensis]